MALEGLSVSEVGEIVEALKVFSADLTAKDYATLVAGTIGVGSVMKGIHEYKGLDGAESEEEVSAIKKRASSWILGGNLAMLSTTALAWSPKYFFPEVLAAITGAKSWLEAHHPDIFEAIKQNVEKAIQLPRAEICAAMGAVGVMTGLVLSGEIQSVPGGLASLGISILSIAYNMVPDTAQKEKIFYAMTHLGGGALVAGPGFDLAKATANAGKIMSFAFLTLNSIFTVDQIRIVWPKIWAKLTRGGEVPDLELKPEMTLEPARVVEEEER